MRQSLFSLTFKRSRTRKRGTVSLALLTAVSLMTLSACTTTEEASSTAGTVAQTKINTVYALGQNAQLELGHYQKKTVNPLLVRGVQGSVKNVAASGDHTLVLTTEGDVYGFGNNALGQLGLEMNTGPCLKVACPYVTEPTLVTNLPTRIIAVAASTNYSLAADSAGKAYVFGGDTLGVFPATSKTPTKDDEKDEPHPRPRELTELSGKVTALAAAPRHALFLTENGKVFGMGDNCFGELGTDTALAVDASGKAKECPQVVIPVAVKGIAEEVRQVAVGDDFSLVLTATGEVYAFGRNSSGQLGNGSVSGECEQHCKANPRPQKVQGLPDKAIAIAAGDDHSLVLTADGKVYGFGANHFGQLGNTNPQDQPRPVLVKALPVQVKAIAAGDSASYAIGTNGKLYGWGKNDNGNLAGLKAGTIGVAAGEVIALPGAASTVVAAANAAFVLVEQTADR